ncbi:hypothetical protein SK128_025683 [Halocaridina rubra]|uniref:Uncharacterized protein n=1 Tax=Halocaridina rubra TaxID=373956 RepID=A0AAN8WSR6_HALRR
MLSKMLKKMILAINIILLLDSSMCVPLSRMNHTTLHVRTDDQTLVFTVVLYSNDTDEALGRPGKTHGQHLEGKRRTLAPEVAAGNGEESSSTTEGSEVLWSLDAITKATSSPGTSSGNSSSSSSPGPPSGTSSSTPGTNDTTTTKIGVIVNPGNPDSGTQDVSHFLVTLPQLSCPQGFRPDPSGICREVFSLLGGSGKSMITSNYLSANVKKFYGKSMMKKLIG